MAASLPGDKTCTAYVFDYYHLVPPRLEDHARLWLADNTFVRFTTDESDSGWHGRWGRLAGPDAFEVSFHCCGGDASKPLQKQAYSNFLRVRRFN